MKDPIKYAINRLEDLKRDIMWADGWNAVTIAKRAIKKLKAELEKENS